MVLLRRNDSWVVAVLEGLGGGLSVIILFRKGRGEGEGGWQWRAEERSVFRVEKGKERLEGKEIGLGRLRKGARRRKGGEELYV